MLKLSAPMKSTPENVVTEPLDKEKTGEWAVKDRVRGERERGEEGREEGEVSSLQSDLFAKSGHNESIMSPLIRESVWGAANWA